MSEIRVRFAPSPTGPLHIGGVRTALYNFLFARQSKGRFILRIEDTDQKRFVPGAEEYILESLSWAGLNIDEGPVQGGPYGPYRQSERKDIYKKYSEQLLKDGHAYMAFDTPEELEAMRERMRKEGNPSPQYNAITRQYMKNSLTLPADEVEKRLAAGEPYVIRIKMPRNEEVKVKDLIRGWVSFQSNQLDDKVLVKADGLPTYHLANVVDDHLMKISHVIRGEEWLPSTPLHVLLYRYLGWEESMPEFAHLPLILRPDGKGKLSKRDGDRLGIPVYPITWKDPASGEESMGFREKGFFPEAFVNMLAFLGWNPGSDQEIFSLDELIKAFSIERIGKAGARFDIEKARWFNQQFLKRKDDAELADMLRPYLEKEGVKAEDAYLVQVCRLMKERAAFIPDIYSEGKYFFAPVEAYDEKIIAKKWNDSVKPFFTALRQRLTDINPFEKEVIEKAVKSEMELKGMKFGQVLPVFRVMLCGTVAGPPIFDVAELLGKEEVLVRMDRFMERYA